MLTKCESIIIFTTMSVVAVLCCERCLVLSNLFFIVEWHPVFPCLGHERELMSHSRKVSPVIAYVCSCILCQAPSMDVKNTWVSEIRKVLTSQLEACRGISEQTFLNLIVQAQSDKNKTLSNLMKLSGNKHVTCKAKLNCKLTMTTLNNLTL